MKIAVIGSGYVGLVAAACFAELGHEVTCVDKDEAKIAAIQKGIIPIYEQFLPGLLKRHAGRRLTFTSSTHDAVRANEAIFIAVGTPPKDDGAADLSYVESVAREAAHAVNGFKLVVEKSTVPVYTNEWVHRVMAESGAAAGHFEVVSNPEFLREGSAVTDFLYPDRIVIGCHSQRAAKLMQAIYQPLLSGEYARQRAAVPRPAAAPRKPRLIATSAKSAELIKHASNAFLAMKISFINAVATICERVGADVEEVASGIGSDHRIGEKFLRAGLGYGGSCFPKDVAAFRAVARDCGYEFRLLDEVVAVNEEQREAFLRRVRQALWTLKGKKLAALGLAFKGGTDDIRESPAVETIAALLAQGCEVVAFDPAAMKRAQSELSFRNLRYARNAYEAAKGADALLVLTDWEEFAKLDLEKLRSALAAPIVLDGRNVFEPTVMAQHGFDYYSVGRPAVVSKRAAASAEAPHLRGLGAAVAETD
jgi:UDPglucose 6-dehydrogenase